MTYTVAITSQGQLSIPIQFRRELGLDKVKRAFVSLSDGKIIVEPAKDLLELRGSLKTNIRATSRQIREAFENYLAQDVVKRAK